MAELLKIVSTFLACAVAFGKVGMPMAVVLFKFNFLKVFLVSTSGGIAGSIFFTNLSAVILKKYHQFRVKKGRIHRGKIFTKSNRRIIKVKQKFGLAGIAFLTPMLLSYPIGALLADRFFKNKKKIVLYLSIATIFWSVTIYSFLLLFRW